MLLAVRIESKIDRLGRKFAHEMLQLQCDVCNKEWEIRGSKDRELDAYAVEKKMCLVRITDKMFYSDPDACLEHVERKL